MRLLLDTHFLIWSILEPEVLRAREAAIIGASEVLISPVSIWELRIKWHRRNRHGERKGRLDPVVALKHIDASAMTLMPFSQGCAGRCWSS